ncbi:MAG: HAMP domain-containing histidine kinase [Candidatus Kuenenia sp.]|nr:HAMP domain-containing histidine kinase [Candidatus Kuenenia hertensis]
MPKFKKILHPEKFNLILYYTITSFAIIAILSFVIGKIFARLESQEFIKRSEKYAHNFISHINYEIYKDFLIPTLKKSENIDLENNRRQLRKLDNTVRENLYGLNIRKLYLYDLEGNIIYSTVSEHIGFAIHRGENKKLDSAINGTPASALRLAGTVDSKGTHVPETLLESYYPFYEMNKDGTKKAQVGVLEIYQDMSELKKQIKKAHQKATIMTGSAMGGLFFALYLIVLKAARIINARTRQLTEARNTLEQKVEEQTLEIREAYKKLQHTQRKLVQSEKLASIGTLATGLAHEINNPLASVAGCAEGLNERLVSILSHQGKYTDKEELEIFSEYLKIISNETYRCKSIISNLLNFSRQSEPNFERIDVNQIINDTVATIQYQYPANEAKRKIQINLSDRPCEIIGDPQQIKQVFINLITNSFHATETGGEIIIETKTKKTTVQIIFKDTGIGINPEHLDRIFDPFFTTKPTGKGTGIGLSICYGIIDMHSGRIDVFSEGEGKGAVFEITLPLAGKQDNDMRTG